MKISFWQTVASELFFPIFVNWLTLPDGLLPLRFVTISDRKSEMAFKCLVAMLPAGAKRGVKGPKMSAVRCVDYLFKSSEVCLILVPDMRQIWETSDISVSKINSVSITVLRIIGSIKFLLYFHFGKLFRFSFSFQFLNHFYFSFH